MPVIIEFKIWNKLKIEDTKPNPDLTGGPDKVG